MQTLKPAHPLVLVVFPLFFRVRKSCLQEKYLHIAVLVTRVEVFSDLRVIGTVLNVIPMFAESARQCHSRLSHADHIAAGAYDTIDGVLSLASSPALRFDGDSPLGVADFVG